MDISISIGGFTIRMREPHDYPTLAWPLRPFESFVASSGLPADIHVDVSVVSPLPDFGSPRLRFDAGAGLWKLLDTDAGLAIESLHTSTQQPRVRALVFDDYRRIHAWILPEYLGGQVGWCPMYLFNPVVEVCFLARLAREGGILLHAAGLVSQESGLVFTGPSGAGKSTIARMFADRHASVLSDERVVLRVENGGLTVYGSPWVGSGEFAVDASAALTALYLIRHARDHHRISAIPSSTAVSQLLQQSFLPHWDRDCMERSLEFLISVVSSVPCRRLAFLRHADLVDLVQQQSPVETAVSP
ncbi:MAG: hypothetical protein QM706_16870 [Nitrospira sp.]